MRKWISLLVLAVVLGAPLLAPAQQTPQQTPTSTPVVIPPGVLETGTRTPATPGSRFFISPSTPGRALGDITFDASDPVSIRGAARDALLLAIADNASLKNLIIGRDLTFGQQLQVLVANLTPGSALYNLVLQIQQAWFVLPQATRDSFPPFGSAEIV